MSQKNVKNLNSEFPQFKDELKNLQAKFDVLSKKQEALEMKQS